MDFNYCCDESGKFLMGMDFVFVYEESMGGNEGSGIISILFNVVNNLGVRIVLV